MQVYDWIQYRDPVLVLERKQEREARQVRMSPERKKLERLFEGETDMGRKLEIPMHITAVMHQWGEWAARPNFWADLRITPFCKLMGMASAGSREPKVRLDPQSQAIHRAYLGLACEKTRAVLFAYYVMGASWDDRPELFGRIGISRDRFYKLLRTGSTMVTNRAQVSYTKPQTIPHVIPSKADSVCKLRHDESEASCQVAAVA
ncbi:hypothetical protein IMZ29_00850 [Achromobacter sp. GG226]|uniref:hypothetical protein n=1 Tax=Verticiella alkaliphila TaxID=2779529 RepID=UPI001C0C44CD|nr:hypothetical protein [Verticiella sp. GG226]MBU4609151.1 hypothetical protein [Verticiella sp. GG226]